jgi:hypothetical protein
MRAIPPRCVRIHSRAPSSAASGQELQLVDIASLANELREDARAQLDVVGLVAGVEVPRWATTPRRDVGPATRAPANRRPPRARGAQDRKPRTRKEGGV